MIALCVFWYGSIDRSVGNMDMNTNMSHDSSPPDASRLLSASEPSVHNIPSFKDYS